METKLRANHDTFRSGGKSIAALGMRVPESSLERCIKCVFAHYDHQYEQAFAIIMSVFLYVMDEASAFHCFCRWRNQFINKYFDSMQVQAHVRYNDAFCVGCFLLTIAVELFCSKLFFLT